MTKTGKFPTIVNEKLAKTKDDNSSLLSEKSILLAPPCTASYPVSEQVRKTPTGYGTEKGGTTEPWMQRYTTSTFGELHAQVHSVITYLMELPEHQQHKCTQRWNTLHTTKQHPPMTAKMTWKHLEQCLNINNFSQYRDFILQCPKLQDYLKSSHIRTHWS